MTLYKWQEMRQPSRSIQQNLKRYITHSQDPSPLIPFMQLDEWLCCFGREKHSLYERLFFSLIHQPPPQTMICTFADKVFPIYIWRMCMYLQSFWFHHVQFVIRALPCVQNSVHWYLAVQDWKHEGQGLLSGGIPCYVTQLADRLCVCCKD